MQIIIDIPEEKVERLIRQMKLDRNFSECKIIELPKGHGRLYDEKAIRKGIKNPYQCATVLDGLKLVEPIIGAESEESNEQTQSEEA